jgi:mono/diheme cytochrome c family protein
LHGNFRGGSKIAANIAMIEQRERQAAGTGNAVFDRQGGTMSAKRGRRKITGAMVATVMAVAGGSIGPAALAQQQGPAQERKEPAMDYLQRSDQIYDFRKAANSGPERGREIFYYKCWFCHNEFTKDIPKLTGLYQHPSLISGEPVNDETVKNQIRNGSADMAAYKTTLSEADLNDLVSFLREECCWNSDAPPPNPAYRAR